MATDTRPVIVEMVKRPVTGSASRWLSHQWGVGRVLEADESTYGASPADVPDGRLMFSGLNVELHHSEAEGYWLNLHSAAPCLFVMWREESGEPPVPWVVTASYHQAGRMLDAGEKVEHAPLPEAMRGWVQAFTDQHYTPEVRKKVKRNDPFKDGAFRREIVK